MTILAQLQQGSFRGVPFLFNTNNETGGRKSVTYEFPNRDKRTVSDLGKLLKKYKIKAIIKGAAQTYLENRDQLIQALEAPGTGQLVHPIDGIVTVFAKPFKLTETISQLGYGEFDLEFEATTEPIFPTQTQSEQSAVFSLIDEINTAVQTAFEAAWDTVFLVQNTISNVRNAIDNVARVFKTAAALIDIASDFVTPLFESINSLFDSANLLSPTTLANNINASFSNLFNGAQSPEDQSIALTAISGFNGFENDDGQRAGLIGLSSQNTVSRLASNKNILLINVLVNTIALNYNYSATTSTQFDNENNIIQRRDELSDQLQFVLDNNSFKDFLGFRQPLLGEVTFEDLQKSSELTGDYLRTLDNTSHKINTITIGRDSLVPLVYKLYGNLDLLQTIADLNQFGDPTDIKGTIKVVAS